MKDWLPDPAECYGLDLEVELAAFEAKERQHLGLPDERRSQWSECARQGMSVEERSRTTMLVSGLTIAQDLFVQCALRGLGYNVEALECPDNESLRFGKEFGNRAQCNPTYFTVGNLVKHLSHLRDERGLSAEQIIDRYVFLTAGACGPCRFGTYVTEYRKALRDSGFEGFRVLLFEPSGGLKQATGEQSGLELNGSFFLAIFKALLLGDVLNALGYRVRPYELEQGATDAAIKRCREMICSALERRRFLAPTLWKCRRQFQSIRVDRTRVKPRVGVIGEFWAMTTEGDGNYRLQSFLEAEGAEVEVQLISAWLLYVIWQGKHDTLARADLRGCDSGRHGLAGVDVRKKLIALGLAECAIRVFFKTVARAMGLRDYRLPDMEKIAKVSHEFYDVSLRGGEGHLEVGKLILNVVENKVNMTLSVKPFGCMPSSSVSDGVQYLITELYPECIFQSIETSGDGAVNAYSRIQMQLFKARQAAEKEVTDALAAYGIAHEQFQSLAASRRLSGALHRSPHRAGCTAADLAQDIGVRRQSFLTRLVSRWSRSEKDTPQSDQAFIQIAARGARAWQKAEQPSRAGLGSTALVQIENG